MDINHHHKLISSSTWVDQSFLMDDQIIQDHNPFEPFWPNYVYENNQIIASSSTSPQQHLAMTTSTNNHHHHHNQIGEEEEEDEDEEELGAMKEMMFKIASLQPVDIDPATLRKPKRRNVRISEDPQSVAARHRRERISEKIRILQRLVPGGTKMDTASMLDEAIRYVKFLKRQIRQLQSNPPSTTINTTHHQSIGMLPPVGFPTSSNWGIKSYGQSSTAGASYSFGGEDYKYMPQ